MNKGTRIVRWIKNALSFVRLALSTDQTHGSQRTEPVIAVDRRRVVRQLGIVMAGLALVKTRIAEAVYKTINSVRIWRSPDKHDWCLMYPTQ